MSFIKSVKESVRIAMLLVFVVGFHAVLFYVGYSANGVAGLVEVFGLILMAIGLTLGQ